MLLKLNEEMLHDYEAQMIASGETDINLDLIINTGKMLETEFGVTPLYILDLEDGSLAVYIAETFDRSKLH